MEIEALRGWVGRSEVAEDSLAPGPLAGLAALLDHENPPWPTGEAPPLAHWLYFLPRVRQSDIDRDGHPKRGGFLPPVSLPRRMWAGGRLDFLRPIDVGAKIERQSSITGIRHKQGATGDLVFVTVRHDILANGQPAIVEEQDIVFLGDSKATPPQATPARRTESLTAEIVRVVTPDPVQLFRFSAITFNAHRIHYDRDYCRDVENYAGLVVHGPLQAILLVDHFLRVAPNRRVTRFSFTSRQPLLDNAPFELCLAWTAEGAKLWTRNVIGQTAMAADLVA